MKQFILIAFFTILSVFFINNAHATPGPRDDPKLNISDLDISIEIITNKNVSRSLLDNTHIKKLFSAAFLEHQEKIKVVISILKQELQWSQTCHLVTTHDIKIIDNRIKILITTTCKK